jgi:phosphosulfolactate synthase (CoM biosynthesis protein A)
METIGGYIDGMKSAGASFALMPSRVVAAMNQIVHDHAAYVSTGGWKSRPSWVSDPRP